MEQPKRAITIKLEIGADDIDALEQAFDSIIFKMRMDDFPENVASGGYSWGGGYSCQRREITHDQYFTELDKFLESERNKNILEQIENSQPKRSPVASHSSRRPDVKSGNG